VAGPVNHTGADSKGVQANPTKGFQVLDPTQTKLGIVDNATIHPVTLSADTPGAANAPASQTVVPLTEKQQKALAFAAEASMDAVQKAEAAQSAKNLADPLRKVHREAADAVLKARDQLQTHESSAFHASIKAKQAELEAEMLRKAVAMARSSASARREIATASVAKAAELHAVAQVASKEASSAQEDSRRALAEEAKVAVAKAALDRSKVALSARLGLQPVSSAVVRAKKELQRHEADEAQADLEARQAQGQAQTLAIALANARRAISANTSVADSNSRHS
jgi:hypothetical protein